MALFEPKKPEEYKHHDGLPQDVVFIKTGGQKALQENLLIQIDLQKGDPYLQEAYDQAMKDAEGKETVVAMDRKTFDGIVDSLTQTAQSGLPDPYEIWGKPTETSIGKLYPVKNQYGRHAHTQGHSEFGNHMYLYALTSNDYVADDANNRDQGSYVLLHKQGELSIGGTLIIPVEGGQLGTIELSKIIPNEEERKSS